MVRSSSLVVVTRKLPEPVEREMSALFNVRLNDDDRPMDATTLTAAVREAEILVPTVGDRVTRDIINAAGPQLKLIANFGVGFNHIDAAAAAERGIAVTNTPGVLTDATADIAMTLMLAVTRRALEGAKVIETGRFSGWCPTWMMGVGLRGRKLGIVGMGRIGEAVARRSRAFGLEIHYNNRKRLPRSVEQDLAATYWPELDAMLPNMDIVSVNCPFSPDTFHLFSAERLARMKPSAYLINTARGEIVDEVALADALASGHLAGAGLDVFEREPKVEPKLLTLGNAVLLPHLGSSTIEARTGMGNKVIANIRAFIAGEPLPDRVI
ncbi:MAG TPA: D-glycerate dehydrogenase [Micropepsaceae bacterium]|nr:D-glycerate dehydrogenase [Micropepsaceae bacterium]